MSTHKLDVVKREDLLETDSNRVALSAKTSKTTQPSEDECPVSANRHDVSNNHVNLHKIATVITPQCSNQSEDERNGTAHNNTRISTRQHVTTQINHGVSASRKSSSKSVASDRCATESTDSDFASSRKEGQAFDEFQTGEYSTKFPTSLKNSVPSPSQSISGSLSREIEKTDLCIGNCSQKDRLLPSTCVSDRKIASSRDFFWSREGENYASEHPKVLEIKNISLRNKDKSINEKANPRFARTSAESSDKRLDLPDKFSDLSKDLTPVIDSDLSRLQKMGKDTSDKNTHDAIHSEVDSAGRTSSQSSSSNGSPIEELKDPWVRLDTSEVVTTRKTTFNSHNQSENGNENSDIEANKPENESILQKSSSEAELEKIQGSRSGDEITSIRKQEDNGVNIQNRVRYDLDLLTRPTWCDARFALSRVEQGKAKGNIYSLRLRAFLHQILFSFGCFIQRYAVAVLCLGILILGVCAIGLTQAHMETNIEHLWVETGGRLSEELEYTRMSLNPDDEAGSSTASTGYSIQMLIQTGENALTRESVMLHLKAAIAATEVTVALYNQTWSFSDVCFKQTIPVSDDSAASFIAPILDKLFPCFIISPLDCFWEGAKLLGPTPPIYISKAMPDVTWTSLHPLDFIDQFVNAAPPSSSLRDDLLYYRDLMSQGGITSGYQERWCLNPNDPECPKTAPNYDSKELPDIKALFGAGCSGFASELMQWPIDLIVGGIERNATGNITHALGLQTLFNLMSADNMYEFHKGIKTGDEWSVERAEEVLAEWQRNFVERIYSMAEDKNTSWWYPDTLNAFSTATADDILIEFSNISFFRVFGGYLLMMGYACLSLMRWRASRSQGAVGVIGVLLVALSVAAGLGICSFVGISFNAASTQVLPFLLLGLGVDDMFLLAHHFGEISLLSHIPFEERTGECLKRVGVSVFLTSIAILSGFLFSLIIPMPALRAFGLQASIVTVFNLLSVLIIFPAILSLDFLRRKNNKLDILCCFDSSTVNDVVDLTKQNKPRNVVCVNSISDQSCENGTSVDNPNSLPGVKGAVYTEPGESTTITVRHTIQAYANNSYATVLGPSTAATIISTSSNSPDLYQVSYSNSPPPEYTASVAPNEDTEQPNRSKVVFLNQNLNESNASGQSTPATSGVSGKISRRTNSSNPSTNLTTPMESVRSSTHSLVSRKRKGPPSALGGKRSGSLYACLAAIPSLTISQLAERYYAPLLLKNPVRVIVILLFAGLLGASIYGATQIEDGLDFGDVLPRDTREHDAVVVQTTYFSFFNMYIITKDFDYASNQKHLDALHDSMESIRYVMRNTDGTLTKYWLDYMREWLQDLQYEFDKAWINGYINATTWTPQASDKAVLAYKLLLQTGRAENPIERGNIGCRFIEEGKPCEKVDRVRLVSNDQHMSIPEAPFYNYLSAWVGNDPLAYAASQGEIRPRPNSWSFSRDLNMIIPRSPAITYTQMPFYLNNMRENQDFVNVINWVRESIENVEAESTVLAYPSGYPFTFWQQYIDLRFWLFVSLGCVILAVFLVLSIVLFNPWAAFIMAVFLAMIATELLGFMGASNVKLSAVPAVILVASIGLGVEFTVHITFAYLTSCGSRKDRVKHSIGHMLGPVVDGSISTLLGVVMLAGAEFDFIITYFFHVLAILILLGFLNGLILLPVVLSFIGPPSEVIPLEGRSRLKTPTPPSTPPGELECGCSIHYHTCGNTNINHSNNCNAEVNCHHRSHIAQRPRYPHSPTPHFSSRDEIHAYCGKYQQHPNNPFRKTANEGNLCCPHAACHPAVNLPEGSAPHIHHDLKDPRHFDTIERDEENVRWEQHPFSVPPHRREDASHIFVYPHTEYVIYSNSSSSHEETLQDHHCETDFCNSKGTSTSQGEQLPEAEENQKTLIPALTAMSSLTVKVHSGRQPVVAFVETPTAKMTRTHLKQPEKDVSLSQESESPSHHSSKRRFDISALTALENINSSLDFGRKEF